MAGDLTPEQKGGWHSGRFAHTFAAIDLGTNNCRLLVARASVEGFEVIDAYSRPVRLGEGVALSGTLCGDAIDRTLEALDVCAAKIGRHRVTRARHIATEACRRACNGEDFLGLRPLREGEDPRDIHWRKSAALGHLVARERAREARPDVTLSLDAIKPASSTDEWDIAFERRIREIASRAVAHLKRGDSVTVRTSTALVSRGDRSSGADPILRFLALLDAQPARDEKILDKAAE
jgi:hypothetical protein